MDQLLNHLPFDNWGYVLFEKHSWIGVALVIAAGLTLLSSLGFGRLVVRALPLLLPLSMIACVLLNGRAFAKIDADDQWHLQPLAGDSILDLAVASHDPIGIRRVYLALEQEYAGWTLSTTSGLLSASALDPFMLRHWGRLAGFVSEEYDPRLSGTEEQALLSLAHFEVEGSPKTRFVFITGDHTSTGILHLMQGDSRFFLVPASLLSAPVEAR